jgi:hypothetical protein
MRTYNKTVQWLYGLGQGALIALLMALVVVPMLSPSTARAEGSVDLCPADADESGYGGYRPFLSYDGNSGTWAGFADDNIFYVYVQNGETLNLSSSANGKGDDGKIRYKAPSGESWSVTPTTCGVIADRAEELSGDTNPCVVDVDETGVWQVQFVSPKEDAGYKTSGDKICNETISANWTQSDSAMEVVAWDVTVKNSGDTVQPGRLYATYLQLNMMGGDKGFKSEVYIQSVDGPRYRVNMNNLMPFKFAFFSNNAGARTKADGKAVYRSIQLSDLDGINGGFPDRVGVSYTTGDGTFDEPFFLHYPNQDDDTDETDGNGKNVTHHIFFNPPDPDYVTTLYPTYEDPLAQEDSLTFTGADTNAASGGGATKSGTGGTFTFMNDEDNPGTSYALYIDVSGNETYGDSNDRVLRGSATSGLNPDIKWDGKDGNGDDVAAGNYDVKLVLNSGEIHFPFFDAEKNPGGTIIQRLYPTPADDDDEEKYKIYYNDQFNWKTGSADDDYDYSICAASGDNPQDNNGHPAKLDASFNSKDTCYGGGGAKPSPRDASVEGENSSTNGHKWELIGTSYSNAFGDKRMMDTWTFVPSSASLTIKVIIDDTAPVVTVDKPQKTSDTTPKITGTVNDKDATVTVTVDGKEYDATVSSTDNGDGTYNWEVPDNAIQSEDALTPGETYDVDAVATDKAGNQDTDDTSEELEITAANDPPTVSDISKSGPEDKDITFAATDFTDKFTDDDDLTKVKITSLPANGTLYNGTTAVKVNDEIDAADLGNLKFTPNDNWNGDTSFGWNGHDGTVYADTPAKVNITITEVQDKPTVADISKSGPEDTDITFTAKDFTDKFTDDDDDDLTKVKITSLPANGTLYNGTTEVKVNDEIDAADLGNLKFTPDDNWNGTTSFGWNGHDGTVYADTPAKVNITITEVQDKPTVADISKSGPEDTDITFTAKDFTDKFTDDDDDDLTKVKITSLPANGTLYNGTTAVKVNDEIDAADLGNLKFTPNDNWNGDTSFGWNGNDGTVYADTPAKVNITVSGTNDPPTLITDTLTLDKGATSPITETQLTATDTEDDDPTLTYTLVTTPTQGNLYKKGSTEPLAPNATFTQAEINAGDITYTHTASTTTPDQFTAKVSDSDDAESETKTVPITIVETTKPDSDGDTIPDEDECTDINNCDADDTDGDNIPDYKDPDDDGDGIPTKDEGTEDPDGDTIPNYKDDDSDGDGIPDNVECSDYDKGCEDSDSDTIPDYKETDSDGDTIPDSVECPNYDAETGCEDSDGDEIPNYRETDSDGDKIPDNVECSDSSNCEDTDEDTIPNYRDTDSDGDTIPDEDEDYDGEDGKGDGDPTNDDSDGDKIPDYLDKDDDNDGIPTKYEDVNRNGDPTDDDTDGDGIPNYLDNDDDKDDTKEDTNLSTIEECPDYEKGCPDTDGDTIPDYLEPNNVDTDNDGNFNNNDPDDDGDTVPTAEEDPDNNGTPLGDDTNNDGKQNYLDNNDDGDCYLTINEDYNGDGNPANDDSDNDGLPEYLDPSNDDTDGDGIPNCYDDDDDGDGILSVDEDLDGDGNPNNDDTDGDGIPNYLDNDDDNDGILTGSSEEGVEDEDLDGDGDPTNDDTDGDTIPDYLEPNNVNTNGETNEDGSPKYNYMDPDDDGDGIPTKDEDADGNGTPLNDDADGDGIPDFLERDEDGDGETTLEECPAEQLAAGTCPDNDGDDDAGDGVPDYMEPDNRDTDNDGIVDEEDLDDDGDGIPTRDEDPNGDGKPFNDDTDGDGIPNYLDGDDDNDGIATKDEGVDPNGDGDPSDATDADGDGIPDYLEPNTRNIDNDDKFNNKDSDDDGDGIPTAQECPNFATEGCPDTDKDGKPDYLDADDDNDGILTKDEDLNGDDDLANDDTDGDGIPNYLDDDDDGDGTKTKDEDLDGEDGYGDGDPTNDDSDGDGIPNYLEPDNQDTDNDGKKDQDDPDDDGDGIPTKDEDRDDDGSSLNDDDDGDGIPNYKDDDDDGDGIPTAKEDINGDGDPTNDDTDRDGLMDYLDTDDDGDGIPTKDEAYGKNTDPAEEDTDGDGIPNYLDNNDNGDGVDTVAQGKEKDTDGDGIPDYLDMDVDGDGIPNPDESVDNDGNPGDDDTDKDGIPNYMDTDDDGDGIPTKDEDVNGDGDPTNDDTDGDGIPNYLDADDNGDSEPTKSQGTTADMDGDKIPDYLDMDVDGDGIPNPAESVDGDKNPGDDDTDGDGIPNYKDADDNGDGVPTAEQGAATNTDTDGDGIPDYLDDDVDGDGIPNGDETLPIDTNGDGVIDDTDEANTDPRNNDSDGDGIPDFMDTDDNNDGIPTKDQGTIDDVDGDEIPDYRDPDVDGDTITNWDEDLDEDGTSVNDDSDGDGIPNFKDKDDNNDFVPTKEQVADEADENAGEDGKRDHPDTDEDGTPDYLDNDIDGDGKENTLENPNKNVELRDDDSDGDGIPDFMDPLYNAPTLLMDFVCDSIATAGSTLNCTIIYTNTGAFTPTTSLWIGVTQPENTMFSPDRSDPRWRMATGEVTATDGLSGEMIAFDYAVEIATKDNPLASGASGTIQIAFTVDKDLPLGAPLTVQGVFQNNRDDLSDANDYVDTQDKAIVNVAKAIYMPLVAKVTTQ